MTSPLTAPRNIPTLVPRYRSPVFLRYATVIALMGILPLVFLGLKELALRMAIAEWFREPAVHVLGECARTFYGAAFVSLFVLLTLAYGHPRLERRECHALLGIALFLLGGCLAVTGFIRL